jgi:hypothetical protein
MVDKSLNNKVHDPAVLFYIPTKKVHSPQILTPRRSVGHLP